MQLVSLPGDLPANPLPLVLALLRLVHKTAIPHLQLPDQALDLGIVLLALMQNFMADPISALHELNFLLHSCSKELLTGAQATLGAFEPPGELSALHDLIIVQELHSVVLALVFFVNRRLDTLNLSLEHLDLDTVLVTNSCDLSQVRVLQDVMSLPKEVINGQS